MIGKEYRELENTPVGSSADGEEKDLFLHLENASSGSISGVDLHVRKGEVLGFSGLLGSGRSEIARMIFGVDTVISGKAEIGGESVALKEPIVAMHKGIGFCPEERKTEGIVGELTIRENIILALQAKQGIAKPISRKRAIALSDEYIEKLSIKTPGQDQAIKNLSGGNQQKVLLARWLATEPELLMLDEPTRGIDIGAKAEIQKYVVQLAEGGMAVIFISSEIDEMLRCCNRMIVLRDKKIVGELSGAEITEEQIMKSIAGGGTVETDS
jgi:simple sugar transport system ATP-binding protein